MIKKTTKDRCPDCGTKGVSPEEYEVLQHYVKDSGVKGISLSDYKKLYMRLKSRKSKPKAKGCGCK